MSGPKHVSVLHIPKPGWSDIEEIDRLNSTEESESESIVTVQGGSLASVYECSIYQLELNIPLIRMV